MKTFKIALIGLLFLIFSGSLVAQSQEQKKHDNITKVILTRHMEKAEVLDSSENPENPHLTDNGNRRAEYLRDMFQHISLDYFYSTPLHRTQETLLPTANSRNKEIQTYATRDFAFIQKQIQENPGKNFMIAGHSNSIPSMVNYLIGEDFYEILDESDYTKLWILTFKNGVLIDHILLQY